MPIVPSRAERIRELVGRLASEGAAERDSAVAQLTLIGSRIVAPLRASLAEAPARARLASLEVLERLEDPRALPAILALVSDPNRAVALRAIELTGEQPDNRSAPALAAVLTEGPLPRRRAAAAALAALHHAGVVEALAPLVDTLVDETADARLRLDLLDTVAGLDPALPRRTLKPLARRLASSQNPALASRAEELTGVRTGDSEAGAPKEDTVDRLAAGPATVAEARSLAATLDQQADPPLERLRDTLDRAEDPRAVQALAVALETIGGPAAIPALKRALARLADGPASVGDPDERLTARAVIHSSLAALDSRVALHDLRELVVLRPAGLMPGLLEAAAKIGDASLVPALAQAATDDPTLLEPCGATYRTIARREKLRRTSSALRKVRAEHRAALDAFASRSRRR